MRMNRFSFIGFRMRLAASLATLALCFTFMGCSSDDAAGTGGDVTGTAGPATPVVGWLEWRGPLENGTTLETDLPTELSLEKGQPGGPLWTLDLKGRGTPVIVQNGDEERAYVWGYRGERYDLVEVLACVDANTGEVIWEHEFADFISDIVYDRYAIGAPSVDPETGNIYLMTTPGLFVAFTPEGQKLWEISMMEAFGRLTFPNGRTGSPAIDGDLVILNAITTNWGAEGPARNRFYAFDKFSGQLVWSSTPGVGPPFLKDSSFCTPVFETRGDRRVMYAGTGCGNVVCVDVATGQPLWRYQMSYGGVNSQPVIVDDVLVAVHGKENADDSGSGRIVGLDLKKIFDYVETASVVEWPVVINPDEMEAWRVNDVKQFTSSPAVIGSRVFIVTIPGELFCIESQDGTVVWHEKVGADQLHASPLVSGDTMYLPTWHDGLYILKPTDKGIGKVQQIMLNGDLIGSPSAWNGKLFMHTTTKLYCFGKSGDGGKPAAWPVVETPRTNRLLPLPAEFMLRPGETQSFAFFDNPATASAATWEKFIPPTARVKVELDGELTEEGTFIAADDVEHAAGAFKATLNGQSGTTRGRILKAPPIDEDFEGYELTEKNKSGDAFSYPPLPWIGARMKWEIIEKDGNKVLAKTLDNVLFMRSTIFMSHPDESNYTVQADMMTDGNRRSRGDVGVINQRYLVQLRGNNQLLEVVSNHDRMKESVPFTWNAGTWYTMKTRVDAQDDGSNIIRAKVWSRQEDEPTDWTIEVTHKFGHRQGSPGIYGLSPQSLFAVYVDNVIVTPNE